MGQSYKRNPPPNIAELLPLSEHYQVRRTCTDDFEVNYFIVNHACMIEGHRHGHMCFCETDRCNDANKRSALSIGVAVGVSIAVIMSSLNTS